MREEMYEEEDDDLPRSFRAAAALGLGLGIGSHFGVGELLSTSSAGAGGGTVAGMKYAGRASTGGIDLARIAHHAEIERRFAEQFPNLQLSSRRLPGQMLPQQSLGFHHHHRLHQAAAAAVMPQLSQQSTQGSTAATLPTAYPLPPTPQSRPVSPTARPSSRRASVNSNTVSGSASASSTSALTSSSATSQSSSKIADSSQGSTASAPRRWTVAGILSETNPATDLNPTLSASMVPGLELLPPTDPSLLVWDASAGGELPASGVPPAEPRSGEQNSQDQAPSSNNLPLSMNLSDSDVLASLVSAVLASPNLASLDTTVPATAYTFSPDPAGGPCMQSLQPSLISNTDSSSPQWWDDAAAAAMARELLQFGSGTGDLENSNNSNGQPPQQQREGSDAGSAGGADGKCHGAGACDFGGFLDAFSFDDAPGGSAGNGDGVDGLPKNLSSFHWENKEAGREKTPRSVVASPKGVGAGTATPSNDSWAALVDFDGIEGGGDVKGEGGSKEEDKRSEAISAAGRSEILVATEVVTAQV